MNCLLITPEMGEVRISVVEQARLNRDSLLQDAAQIQTVTDRLDADDATLTLKKLSDFGKLIEAQRKQAKEPVLELSRKIDALGKELTQQIEEERSRISRLVGAFEAEERRKAEAERARLEEQARRIQREAEAKIREAAMQAKTEEARDRAVDQVIEQSQAAVASVQQALATTKAKKAEGSKLLTKICYEVTDMAALFKAHPELVILEPNGTAIRAILKTSPNLQVPGLRHWTEQSLSI